MKSLCRSQIWADGDSVIACFMNIYVPTKLGPYCFRNEFCSSEKRKDIDWVILGNAIPCRKVLFILDETKNLKWRKFVWSIIFTASNRSENEWYFRRWRLRSEADFNIHLYQFEVRIEEQIWVGDFNWIFSLLNDVIF